MKKSFLIEQCKRLKVRNKKNTNKLADFDPNNTWNIQVVDEFEVLINEFCDFIESKEKLSKETSLKWLRRRILISEFIIKDILLENSYEESKINETEKYIKNKNIISVANTLINIINKKTYIDKV